MKGGQSVSARDEPRGDAPIDDPGAAAEDRELALPRLVARWAKIEPQRSYLEEVSGRVVSYGELNALAGRWAAAMRALGVASGEPVGSFLPQSIDAHTLWLASARLGALHVPLNPQLRGDLLRRVISDASITTAFASREQVAELRHNGLPSEVRLVEVARDGACAERSSETVRWSDLVASASGHEPLVRPCDEPGDVCSVIYTSGTTGDPKGALVTWAQVGNQVGILPPELLGHDPAYYVPWPPFHVMGLTPLVTMAAVGGRAVLRERVSVGSFWTDVFRHRCTFATIGPIVRLLLDFPPGPQDDDNPLRGISGVSGPERDEFRERFKVRATQVYGSTEIAYPLVNQDDGPSVSSRFTGHLRRGYRARIVDDALADVPDGTAGELLVAPPSSNLVFRGYLGRPDLTSAALHGEFYRTRDVFRRRVDGSLEFVDRMGDSIRRFGENISSADVEAAASQHPGVLECAVVAAPSPISGEEVHLAVVPSSTGVEPASLADWLAGVLPRYMVPSIVSLWPALPKTANGKTQKAAIRGAGVPAGAWRAARTTVRPEGGHGS